MTSEHALEPESEVRRRLQEYEDEGQRIITPHAHAPKWWPHEGPPINTPERALRLYREALEARGSNALTRTVMTDEQRAEFIGDSK